jgi:hypothetical protein
MTIRLNILGETYDDIVPAFFVMNEFAFDRITNKYYPLDWLQQRAQDLGYTLESYELDVMPPQYAESHLGIPADDDGLIAPKALVSVSANAGAGTLTFSDGPSNVASYVQINYELEDGGATTLNVDLPSGTTANQAASLVAAQSIVGGTASATDNVVTITADDASIEQLQAQIIEGAAP